jgi:hypothetical protein
MEGIHYSIGVNIERIASLPNEKEETSFEISSCEMECGGRDSNSHRIAPTTPSK